MRDGNKACCGAHHLGRQLREQGHDVRLMSPEYVRPYVKAQKNDDRDAEAIAEAATRPTLRFVDLKNDERLAGQLHVGRGYPRDGRHADLLTETRRRAARPRSRSVPTILRVMDEWSDFDTVAVGRANEVAVSGWARSCCSPNGFFQHQTSWFASRSSLSSPSYGAWVLRREERPIDQQYLPFLRGEPAEVDEGEGRFDG